MPLMERSKVMPNTRLCISSLTVGRNLKEQARPRCRPESWTVPKTSHGTRRSFPSRLRGTGQPCTARAAPNCTDGRLTCISEPLVVSEEISPATTDRSETRRESYRRAGVRGCATRAGEVRTSLAAGCDGWPSRVLPRGLPHLGRGHVAEDVADA